MDTHEFRTDNKILIELGLGSFTVDTLREWVEKNNHANLNYTGFDAQTECRSAKHNPKKGRVPFPLEPDCVNKAMTYIVGTNDLVDDVDQLYIKNYRPTGRTSEKFTYQWIADRSTVKTITPPSHKSKNTSNIPILQKYDTGGI